MATTNITTEPFEITEKEKMFDSRFKLNAKIKAQNRANQYANELFPKLVAVFQPLIGRKIQRANGTLLAQVESKLPEMPNKQSFMVIVQSTTYSVNVLVQTTERDSEHTVCYARATLYVCDLAGGEPGVLQKLYDAPNLRTDFTAEEVLQKRAAYKVAEKLLDDARSALHPFGEYDQ